MISHSAAVSGMSNGFTGGQIANAVYHAAARAVLRCSEQERRVSMSDLSFAVDEEKRKASSVVTDMHSRLFA